MHESVTALDHLKVQSYILLAHAAIEEYLEGLGREVAREARRRFKSQGLITHALVALIAAKALDDVADKARKRVSEDLSSNLDVFSELALNKYEGDLNSNHGILEKNQKNILLPIGVNPETTDTSLMNTMNAFGMTRGAIAHSFAMIRVEHTAGDVNNTLKTMLSSIANYDKAACEALNYRMTKKSK